MSTIGWQGSLIRYAESRVDPDAFAQSWAESDHDRPDGLDERVTPRDLAETVRESETLYEVTRELRIERRPARKAVHRLGLADEITQTDSRKLGGGSS